MKAEYQAKRHIQNIIPYINGMVRIRAWQIGISGHFLKFKMAARYLYIYIYIYIHSEICRNINIQNSHFKIQYDGQVSCQYHFHIDPYIIVKCK